MIEAWGAPGAQRTGPRARLRKPMRAEQEVGGQIAGRGVLGTGSPWHRKLHVLSMGRTG